MYVFGEESIESMKNEKEYLSQRKDFIRKRSYQFLITGSFLIFVFLVIFISRPFGVTVNKLIYSIALLYALASFLSIPFFRSRTKFFDEKIQDLDIQIDLIKFKVSKRESRAEKLLHINNLQLRRYYELNLNQNIWVFGIGIFCILLGFAIIATSFHLVLKVTTDHNAKIIIAVIGSIGSILANFVAAIYLNMHAKASQNLTDFHTRLVETQQILLGNLLASRIEKDEKRWDTLAQLSMDLIKKD